MSNNYEKLRATLCKLAQVSAPYLPPAERGTLEEARLLLQETADHPDGTTSTWEKTDELL